ncbi:MAG TPA: glycosyltransferase [Candidatus Nanoarchaeia archaeon]|nr:glycosyltransferase [Candidatus Nanoarchaeia archaeon]
MVQAQKITIIVNNLGVGGAERVVVNEVHEMMRMGIDVSLITLRPVPVKSFISELKLPKEKMYEVPFSNLMDRGGWKKLVPLLKTLQPDLLITQLWYANTIGRIAAFKAGVRRVISFEQNVYDDLKTWKMYLVDFVLQFFCTKVIAVSEAVKDSLVRHWILPSRIEVIYNSVDLEAFVANTDGNTFLKNEQNSFVFGFIGRLIHQKAVDVLIDAYANIQHRTMLVIAGQGTERENLEALVKKKGLEQKVMFVGVQKNIPKFLTSIDCFVLASRYEGLPLVLIEAMAAGKPVIVSDFESAKEVVNDKNGIIVPKENPAALTQAMQRVMENADLRKQMSVEARKSAEKFSITNHVRAILRYAN